MSARILLSLFSLGLIASCFAAPSLEAGWEISATTQHNRYHEVTSDRSQLMETQGALNGFNLRYDSKTTNRFHWRLDTAFSQGQVNYHGSLIGSGQAVSEKNDADSLIRGEIIVGKTQIKGTSQWFVFSGLGYRHYWDDSYHHYTINHALDNIIQNVQGVQRSANYFYLPLGFEWSHPANHNTLISFTANMNVLLKGYQKTTFEQADSSINRQDHGHGFHLAITLAKPLSDQRMMFIRPFTNVWHIQRSEFDVQYDQASPASNNFYVSQWREPNNYTREIGIAVGMHL